MAADIYTTPLLTARDTARYLAIPESTLDRWLSAPSGQPMVHAIEPVKRGWPRVPFVGIVEAYVLRALRDLGLSMDQIRRTAALVREEFDDPFALATRRIATDGAALFVRLADESIVHAPDRQHAFTEVIERHLRYIDWDSSGYPARLHLSHFPDSAHVVIDPRFGWGAPVLAESKVRVEDLVNLWRSGESLKTVAAEYDLSVDVVEDVVRQAA